MPPANKATPKAPTTTGKAPLSGLMARYGAKLDQAVKEHAADETNYGFTRIPPGINNGIAQLKECYFAQYKSGDNKDEYYCRMMGIVISPDFVNVQGNKVPAKGCQTSLMFPCCDTKGKDENGQDTVIPQSEHIARILNMMRCLGGEEFTQGATGADLERLAEMLQNAKPYFKFTTSPKKDMKTGQYDYNLPPWENWQGSKGLESYSPPEGGGVNDNSPTSEKTVNVDTVASVTQPSANGSPSSVEYTDSNDIASLLSRANENDEQAQSRLTEMALAAGHSDDAVKATQTWDEVVTLINNPATTGGEWQPEINGVYGYTPTDMKTKKPGAKCNVEVTAVYVDKQAVDLKRTDNPKIAYRGIEWSKLEEALST